MTNAKGTIKIEKLNLMGYTPETQMYLIRNGGGAGTFNFLKRNTRHFDHLQFMGGCYLGLRAPRIAKFKEYAEKQGFKVEEAA